MTQIRLACEPVRSSPRLRNSYIYKQQNLSKFSPRRSQRLATKEKVSYLPFFFFHRKKDEPDSKKTTPNSRRSSRSRKSLSQNNLSGKNTFSSKNTFCPPGPTYSDFPESTQKKTGIEALKAKVVQLKTKSKSRTVFNKIINSTPSVSSDRTANFSNPLCSTPLIGKSNDLNDDYFAHVSPIHEERTFNVTIKEVLDISQQFAVSEEKSRRRLRTIATDVIGRALKKNELDELDSTIHGLELSNLYNKTNKCGQTIITGKSSRNSKLTDNFIPKPFEMDSRASTPLPNTSILDALSSTPRTMKYAKHISRTYSCIRKKNIGKMIENPTLFLENSKSKKEKFATSLDITITNAHKLVNLNSYKEYSDESDENND